MKLTKATSTSKKSGMTLLELTVVILVLLSLIAILFVGARAWKKGSDRSANIMNYRNTQQSMRGHQNTRELADGADFALADCTGYMKFPKNIGSTITYTPGTVITPIGTLWLKSNLLPTDADYGFSADTEYAQW